MMQKYEKFLESLDKTDWKISTLSSFQEASLDENLLSISHLVIDIEKAKKIALMEHEKEIYSTYFLSDNYPYFNNWTSIGNYIYQLGHEIGIQPSILAATINGINAHKYIMQLQMSFKGFGFVVIGMKSLETEMSKKMGFKDYEYFYDYSKEEKLIEIKKPMSESLFLCLGVHPLIEYGLHYFENRLERKNTYDLNNFTTFNFLDRARGKTVITNVIR